MEISGAHHQLMASHPLDEVFANPNTRPSNHLLHHQIAQGQLISENQPPAQNQQNSQQPQNNEQPKKPRPHPDQALKCPRCDSTNTKFCYYNNYSLSQPRYFCKGCRRYWTQGGSLRNVPVGGGCRKNKRASPSPRNSSPTPKKIQESPQGIVSNTNPNSNPNPNPNPLFSPLLPPGPESQHSGLAFNPSDLSLAFACNLTKPSVVMPQLPDGYGNPSGFLDILRGGGFVESNANSTAARASSSVANGFPSFYYNYNLSGNHANGAGPENPRDINIVMPAIDSTAASVSRTADGGNAASGGDSLVMQGGNNSSCKASVDGGGVQLEQQLGQGDVNGAGNLSAFAVDSSSGRDYWNVSTVGASSPWQSIINSSLL